LKTVVLQNNFASGVFEPRLKGRTDIEQYGKSLQVGQNIITLPLGGVTRRPGLSYIDKLPSQSVPVASTPTMINGGNPASINDFDYDTSTSTTTGISTTDPYVVVEYDLGSATDVQFIDVIGISVDQSQTTDEFYIQWSSNGSTWNNLFQLSTVDGNAKTYRSAGVSARYWRLVKIGGTDLSASVVTLSGFWMYTEGVAGACRLIDFSVSDADNFLVVLTDRSMSIYENDVLHSYLPSVFTEAQLQTVDNARTDYVMLFVMEDQRPQRLIYDRFQDQFLIDEIPFASIPKFDYNDSQSPSPIQAVYNLAFIGFTNGQLFKLRLEGFETEEIVYEGTGTQATADGVRRALEALPLVGAGGVTVTSASPHVITFSDSSTDNFEIFSGYPTTGDLTDQVTITNTTPGVPRKEDVWSDGRGYPRTITFFQNRMWFGGTKSKFQSLFGSRVNSFFDFAPDLGLPVDPIFVTLDSKRRNAIQSLISSRRLVAFTDGSEWVSNQGVVSPEDFDMKVQSSYGSSIVRPVDVEGNIIFIDDNSDTLRGFLYDFGEDGYTSNNLSLLSSHLIKSPIDMSFAVGAAGEDSIYVFTVNSDGTGSVFNTLRTQGISNFTEMDTNGFIVASEGVQSDVYFGVKRSLNSIDGLYLEKYAKTTYTDSNIYQAIGAPTSTITGLDHLNGVECRVVADGAVMDNAIPSGGSITLSRDAEDYVEVGINYECTIQMMPMAPDMGVTNGVMHKKKIAYQNYMVYETLGLKVDGKIIPQKKFGQAGSGSPLSNIQPPFTGLIRKVEGQLGWDSTLEPVITVDDPLPFTILAIESIVEVS